MKLKTNRGLFKSIIFSILTLGIYDIALIYLAAKETNITCAGDGKKTSGLFLFILFSILTLGIYSWVWYYNIIERWGNYVRKQNQAPSLSGSTYLLWLIVGAFLAGIGILVATHLYLKAWNETNEVYNRLAFPVQVPVDTVKP
jgi:hypothetical protein